MPVLRNVGRNTIIGPGFANVDLTLDKTTAITERLRMNFRAEFFNIMNHANFGLPSNIVFTNASGARGDRRVASAQRRLPPGRSSLG